VIRPALRRGLAEKAVARHGVSIALVCRTFGVSETCYRYSPLLSDENEEIADLLVGLTTARKTWGLPGDALILNVKQKSQAADFKSKGLCGV
jgi:putative transposase